MTSSTTKRNGHITLIWMNLIRDMRAQHKSDKQIVAALYAHGLDLEKGIEASFEKRVEEYKEERAERDAQMRKLAEEVHAL